MCLRAAATKRTRRRRTPISAFNFLNAKTTFCYGCCSMPTTPFVAHYTFPICTSHLLRSDTDRSYFPIPDASHIRLPARTGLSTRAAPDGSFVFARSLLGRDTNTMAAKCTWRRNQPRTIPCTGKKGETPASPRATQTHARTHATLSPKYFLLAVW